MSYYNRVFNENNFDKLLFNNTVHSRQKYIHSSLDKLYSKSINGDLSFKEIDNNIKKCYTNLQHLKNTFDNSKINLIKSSLTKIEKNINNNNYKNILNLTSYSRTISNEKENINISNLNKNSTNLSQNNTLRSSSSSSTITENFKKNLMNDYKPKKNELLKYYPVESSYNLIFGKYSEISPSINLNSSNSRNYFNSQKNFIDTKLLHNSSSINESYRSFMRKKQNEENKNNKNLFLEHQEMKNNKTFIATTNNNDEDINYKQKYNDSLEQIDALRISIQDYQKNNKRLKEKIISLNNQINNSKEDKNKEQELINKYKLEIIENNEKYIKIKKENNQSKEKNQNLIQENKDLTNKMSILIDIIKSKDKIISKIKKTQKSDSDSSYFDSIEEKNNNKIYRRKSIKDYSFDKIKIEKTNKHIEEIKLKIPKYNNKGKKFEIPIKKYSYDQLLKENTENKIKISILNNKLKQYEDIKKKYNEIIENKDNENLSKINNKSIYLESLITEGKYDEINTERTISNNYFTE